MWTDLSGPWTFLVSLSKGDDEAERFFKMERQLMDRTQRNQMTLKQRLEFRKFKMLKLMVMYLQQIPLFGKYCFYGCYCFPNMGQDFTVGKGKPMDEVDAKCRDFSSCYKCLGIDYKGSCSHTQPYSFEGREDPVTKKRYLVCSKYIWAFLRIKPTMWGPLSKNITLCHITVMWHMICSK